MALFLQDGDITEKGYIKKRHQILLSIENGGSNTPGSYAFGDRRSSTAASMVSESPSSGSVHNTYRLDSSGNPATASILPNRAITPAPLSFDQQFHHTFQTPPLQVQHQPAPQTQTNAMQQFQFDQPLLQPLPQINPTPGYINQQNLYQNDGRVCSFLVLFTLDFSSFYLGVVHTF